ncbi:methyl-accepting chemotaxis protein [bacterium]|nr:MAG: methyl-accepting chemotaxis protein [bacterium]
MQTEVNHKLVAPEIISKLINISGRQRMLSQRICMYALLANQSEFHKNEGLKIIELFKTSHQLIVNGNQEFPGLFSKNLYRIFFGIENNEGIISDFIETSEAYFKSLNEYDPFNQKSRLITKMIEMSTDRLLKILDSVTSGFEYEMVVSTDNLSKRIQENNFEIKSILNDVSRLAKRTRMVSINAHILAVNAGEIGKEFKVIANEIDSMAGSVDELALRAMSKVFGEN